MALFGLLFTLLLPLLVAGRETARRWQCADNLRQIAVALLAYHDTHGSLPPAAVWTAEGVGDIRELIRTDGQIKFVREDRPIELTRQNWAQLILPQLGEEELARAFDPSVPATDARNQEARTTRLPVMSCPSDGWNRPGHPYIISDAGGTPAEFARGNYAINGGSQYIYEAPGWLSNPRPNGLQFESYLATQSFALWGDGVAGINKCFALKDFANGRATTVLLNEVRAGVHQIDPRGAWALGQIGSSITWGHGISGDAYGPNNLIQNSDDIRGCIEMRRLLGADYLLRVGMPCCDHCTENNQATSRSQHPGGVNIAMADGAVRFVTDEVDIGLWHVMHSRTTPADILAEQFDERLDGTFAASAGAADSPATANPRHDSVAETRVVNSIGMEFIRIPAGEFMMGLPNEENTAAYPEEAPAHPVRITRPFLLGVHEVTQDQFQKVMGYNPSWHAPNGEGSHEIVSEDTARHPVENVTWYESVEFCTKLAGLSEETAAGRRYRLPTEAEWEYAARAGRTSPYPFTNAWLEGDQTGIISGKAWKKEIPIEPVGSYPANDFGVHDMCGSVFEWTNDWFGLDYYRRSPRDDPQGPETGYLRVMRGWYWLFTGPACVSNMSPPPWRKNPYVGFRVVCEPR